MRVCHSAYQRYGTDVYHDVTDHPLGGTEACPVSLWVEVSP